MIFDTHCHLNSEELYQNIDEVIKNAQEVGVTRFLVVGWNKDSSLLAIKLAEQYDFIYAAIGFHPSDVLDITDEDFESVMKFLDHPKVVCLGEIGLDYYWEKDEKNRELQRFWFKKQLKTANLYKKPVSIHNRDAFQDCIQILKENKPEYGGIMHCYSGSVESLKDVLELGLHIGIGGTLTFKNSKTPKEVCKVLSLEKIVVETDSPYLTPHPYRGQRNEPKYLPLVLKEIAELRNEEISTIEEQIFNNSLRVFHV